MSKRTKRLTKRMRKQLGGLVSRLVSRWLVLLAAPLVVALVLLGRAHPAVELVLNLVTAGAVVALVGWQFGPVAWDLYMQHRERPIVEAWTARVDTALDRKYASVIHASSERVGELDPAPLVIDAEPALYVDLDALERH